MNNTVDTSAWGWIKAGIYILAAVIGSSITYIGVRQDIVLTLTILMIADYISGIVKAWKLKIPITSKKSNKGLIEKIAMLAIPVSIGAVLKVINIPIGVTIQSIFSLLIVAELYSFIGNCYCIYTREDTKEFDAVTAVLKYIRQAVLNLIKRLLNVKK